MKKYLFILACFLLVLHLGAVSQETTESSLEAWIDTAKTFGIDPIDIKWHISGDMFAFLWNDSGADFYDIFTFIPSNKKLEKTIDSIDLEISKRFPDEKKENAIRHRNEVRTSGITEYTWHPAKKEVFFIFNADILKIDVEDKIVAQVTRTVDAESCIKISPDGKWLSFIRSNNIWLLNLEGGSEIQLTDTGSELLINGKYIYPPSQDPGVKPAYEWNSLSSAIAFITTDISQAAPGFSAEKFFQGLGEASLPNPFTPIPRYEVNSIFLNNYKIQKMKLPQGNDYYIRKIIWRPVSFDLLVWQEDRKMKEASFYLANAFNSETRLLMTERDAQTINPHYRFAAFSKNGTKLFFTSEEDGWNHLYSFDIKNSQKQQITKGEWEITGLQGLDEKNNIFVTTTRIRPNQRHLEMIMNDSGAIEQLTFQEGCHRCYPSPSFSDAADLYEGNFIAGDMYHFVFNRPYQRHRITSPPKDRFSGLMINEPKYITIDNMRDGGRIFSRIWQPTTNTNERAPAIILLKNDYSSPTILRSLDKKDLMPQILSEHGYYVLELDTRGTLGYGKNWRTSNYMRKNELDVLDVLSCAEYLSSEPYIDPDRIGLMGSGYGAYLAIILMSKYSSSFRVGIAIDPLVFWEKYDTRFVESVLGNPTVENKIYSDFEISKYIGDIKSKLLLMIDSSRTRERSILVNQYFSRLLESEASFELRYFLKENKDNNEEKIRITKDILAYLTENL